MERRSHYSSCAGSESLTRILAGIWRRDSIIGRTVSLRMIFLRFRRSIFRGLIMLIIGGLRYVVSGGDASKVQDAKNTILYALVGIVVAILAYAAVNFVIGSFIPSATNLTGGTGGGATGPYGASTR